ncbi:baseplate J/gp47 family protein [Ewingella sp. AOP9-I1-14]
MNNKPTIDFEKVLSDSGMPTTKEAIRDEFNAIVDAEGMITNTSKMSPFWKLVTAIVTTPVLWIKDVLANTVLANMFLATASGPMLRMLAWGVNLVAKPASYTKGVIRFIKEDAKQAVTVPAGTIIQTERINGVVYALEVDADTTLAAGLASGLVPVTATEAGGAFNLAPGYYRILPVAVAGISQAVNQDDWLLTPGADEESDDDLRERCRNQFNLVGNYHTDAVYRSMIAAVVGLSVERIFFKHDAPRGPGTANAYLLLDSGVTSQPFIDAVNDYINTKGHHGHGDDMQCMSMPETRHNLTVTLFVTNRDNMTAEQQAALASNAGNMIRCAFRENSEFDVKKTWPYSRFSFSNLGRELHRAFDDVDSITFSLTDIVSELTVPRLASLTVEIKDA